MHLIFTRNDQTLSILLSSNTLQNQVKSSMDYYDTWTCDTCHSEVREDVYPCPTCLKKEHLPQKLPSHLCPVCTFQNPEFATHCQVCEVALLQVPSEINKKPSAVVVCKKCRRENHASNEACLFCESQLYEQSKKECSVCGFKVKQSLFEEHHNNCLLTKDILEQEMKAEMERQNELIQKEQRESLKNLEECIHCRQKILPYEEEAHREACRIKMMKSLVFDEKTRMTPLQIEAIKHMHTRSQKQHNSVKSTLHQRIKKLGYSIEDLNNLQFYIENYAPIIIHIHVAKHMEFFVKDTHYRSQFQTNKSSGSLNRASRTNWENRMFDSKYSKATDFQRVKYGVINFTNDPAGVKVCSGYGPSYFLLKDHVRQRCTFTDQDSSSTNSSIATFKYCFKILSKMNDNELRAAFDASKAKQISSGCTTTYKEIQIHGPIEFKKDIQTIYVSKREIAGNKKFLDMVYEFSKKNGVEHDFI